MSKMYFIYLNLYAMPQKSFNTKKFCMPAELLTVTILNISVKTISVYRGDTNSAV